MKNTCDFKSRFRILKGGKVSLVVSAMLVSAASMVTPAHAIGLFGISDSGDSGFTNQYTYTNSASDGALTGNPYSMWASSGTFLAGIYGYADNEHSTFDVTNNRAITITGVGDGAAGIILESGYETPLTISLTNNGAINIDGAYAGIYGIALESAEATSQIINNANISLKTSFEEASVYGMFIVPGASSQTDGAQLINNGHITINNPLGLSVGMAGGNGNTTSAGIVNGVNGVITIDGAGQITGIQSVANTDISGTKVKNDGKIYVNGVFSEEMPSQIAGIQSYESDVDNTGTVEATINGTFNAITQQIENGVLDVNAYSVQVMGSVTNSGQLNGNLMVMGEVNNAGTIRLPYNANTDTMPASVGTFTNSGTLEIGVLTNGSLNDSGTSYSQLVATNATFSAGSKINVNVLSTSTTEELLIEQVLEDVVFVDGDGSSLTVEGLTITDNSSKLNFERVINDDTSIDLLVLQGQSYAERAAIGGANAGTQSAAAALEAKGIDFVGIVDGDDAGFAKAVASTTPVTTMAANTANTQIMNGLQGIVEMRQNNVMSGMNSGDAMSNKNLWAKAYGSKGTQDNKDGMNGFDVNAYGLGIGADAELADAQRIGAALFYTRAQVDVNNMNQNSDLDVYTALVYGNVKIAQNTDLLYQAGYTWQKTASERIDYFADRYTADFTSKVASLDLKVMQTYKMSNELTLRPLVEATYRHFTNPSYTENGTGTAGALSSEEFTSTQFIVSAGAIGEYKLAADSKLIADLRLGHDFHHDAQSVTSSYEGGFAFTTEGIDNGGWQYDIGMGYETANILGGEINFMYNYQGQGSSFDNHVLSAKYVYKF